MSWTKQRKIGLFPLCLAAAVALTALFFLLCYQYDNKYTYPRPESNLGVTAADFSDSTKPPLFYLVDGWSFYQDQLLEPQEIAGHTPDAYFYLGRYGGFDLGDPDASPHGKGTYRTIILTDGVEREYALELTQIYSQWKLWINGELMQSVGFESENSSGEEETPKPDGRMVTFTASDRVEIVVEVSDDRNFYSGMIYPPAFGSPQAVGRISSERLLLHSGASAVALMISLLCLLLGFGCRFVRPYGALSFLCLCFAGSTAWPLFQALGVQGEAWLLMERVCIYGIFLALIYIQGRMCRVPGKAFWPVCTVGAAVCLSVLIQPLFLVERAGSLMLYSQFLELYKWLTAVWLLGISLWALKRTFVHARTFLTGSCVFACALVMAQLLPLYEPIRLGYFIESAGGLLIFLTGGVLWKDTTDIYRESVMLRAEKEMAGIRLEAQAERARLQKEYVRRTRMQLHESRNRLTLIHHYLKTDRQDRLKEYLEELIPALGGESPKEYTGNDLIDSILMVQFTRAAQMDIFVDSQVDLPQSGLSIDDNDLTSLLMNLLDNALEACQRLADRSISWIYFGMSRSGDDLILVCRNAAVPEAWEKSGALDAPDASGTSTASGETGTSTASAASGETSTGPKAGFTSKPDKQEHGFGLSVIREIVRRYKGTITIDRDEESFSIELFLPKVFRQI